MKKLIYIIVLIGIVTFSCEEPSQFDILNSHAEVPVEGTVELDVPTSSALWIDINAESASFELTGEGLESIEAISVDVRIVSVDETGDNVAGTSVVLEELSSVADLADTITLSYTGTELLSALGVSASDVAAGDKFVISFKKTIAGKVYSDRASYTILVSCPTNIPLGTYQLKGGSDQVTLSYDGAGIYLLSNLNFNYYNPAYGDINAKFLDVCNVLTLQGFSAGTPYGIAWIGEGTWNEETKEISLTYADQTYNSTYFASATFVYVP